MPQKRNPIRQIQSRPSDTRLHGALRRRPPFCVRDHLQIAEVFRLSTPKQAQAAENMRDILGSLVSPNSYTINRGKFTIAGSIPNR